MSCSGRSGSLPPRRVLWTTSAWLAWNCKVTRSKNRGEGRFPSPLPRLPRPSLSPLSEGPVETMLAQADDYAAKNPQNFRETIDRYRQISSRARGTAQEAELERKLDSVISRHQQALRQTL